MRVDSWTPIKTKNVPDMLIITARLAETSLSDLGSNQNLARALTRLGVKVGVGIPVGIGFDPDFGYHLVSASG